MQTLWKAGHLGKHTGREPEVVFGQVREDPSAELLVLRQIPQPAHVFSIASGGCTTFALLATEPESLTACDINPAQCALVELKKALLEQLDTESIRYAFLVSAQSAFLRVRDLLPPRAQEFWASRAFLLSRGLNSCGIVDRQLLRAMRLFRLFIHNESTIRQMLGFDDLVRQTEFYNSRWKSWRWKWSLRLLSNLTLLRVVYGRAVIEKLPTDFALHICEQIDSAFVCSVSGRNPCLWQTFMPHVPPPNDEQLPYHLQQGNIDACKRALSRLTCVTGDAAKVIAEADVSTFDLAALSNILDMTSPDSAETLAEALSQKMKTGAIVLLRFFFPPPKWLLEAFSKWFTYDPKLALACAQADRGLFCKNIYVYLRTAK